jgi:hypothetical protein
MALAGNVFSDGRRQFLDIHDETSVAIDIDHFAFWGTLPWRPLPPDNRSPSIPVQQKSGRTARILKIIELAGPHLVLADTGGQDRLSLGQFK